MVSPYAVSIMFGLLATAVAAAEDSATSSVPAELIAIGAPDLEYLEKLQAGSLEEIQARIRQVRTGRRIALRKAYQANQLMWERGIRDAAAGLIPIRSELASAEEAAAATLSERIEAIRSWVADMIAYELVIWAKRDAGAIGGEEMTLYTAVAARLGAEERLLQLLRLQRGEKLPVGRNLAPLPAPAADLVSTIKSKTAKDCIEAVGRPDGMLLQHLDQASLQEIDARWNVVRSGLFAALYLRVQAIDSLISSGSRFIEIPSGILRLAEQEMKAAEWDLTLPSARQQLRKEQLEEAVADVRSVRDRFEIGTVREFQLYRSIASRLHAEDLLIDEILRQRSLDFRTKEFKTTKPKDGQDLMEFINKHGLRKTVDDVNVSDPKLFASSEDTNEVLETRRFRVRAAQIAALKLVLEIAKSEIDPSDAEGRSAVVELAQAEALHCQIPGAQLLPFQIQLVYAAQKERNVRERQLARALGGDSLNFYRAFSARLFTEEQVLTEVVNQRKHSAP